MAKVSINLNEKLPSEEDDVQNLGEALNFASSECHPSSAAGTVTDHAGDASAELPASAPSDGSLYKARKEAEEPKTAVAVIGSQAVSGGTIPVNDVERKIRRAERFGVPVQLSEAEKRNSRAERFGSGFAMKKPELNKSEELKRKARAERFGISIPEAENEKEKKKARMEKFASNPKSISNEEEKRKARAIRFSHIPGPISQVNSKAAVAGGADGRA